ncbi:reverse transcriptase domain-containing protein [Tanacetum coccineum]
MNQATSLSSTYIPNSRSFDKQTFENYVKANDGGVEDVQRSQGQNLQNQMANVTSLLTSLCDNFKNSVSTSNSRTLPSQTTSTKPETSTEKLQNQMVENTAHVPSPEEEESIFMEIPKPKAKKTVNLDPNSPNPNSYPSKLPYPERMKKLGLEALTPTRMTLELANRSITHPMGIAEDVVVRVDGFTFLADFVVVNFEPDPRVPIILGRPFLRTAKALIDLYEEKLTLRVGKEELVYYANKSKKNKDKNFVHAISIIDFLKADPFSGSTTNTLPPSSSPVKKRTSDNFREVRR